MWQSGGNAWRDWWWVSWELRVGIVRQTNMGDVVVGVCYKSLGQKENGTRWSPEVPSDVKCSMILWFCKIHMLQHSLFLLWLSELVFAHSCLILSSTTYKHFSVFFLRVIKLFWKVEITTEWNLQHHSVILICYHSCLNHFSYLF